MWAQREALLPDDDDEEGCAAQQQRSAAPARACSARPATRHMPSSWRAAGCALQHGLTRSTLPPCFRRGWCGCLRGLLRRRDAPLEPPLAHAGATGGDGWPYHGGAAAGVGAPRDAAQLSPPAPPHLVTPPTPAKTEVEEGSLAAALLDAARAAPRAHAYAAAGFSPQPTARRPRDVQRTA